MGRIGLALFSAEETIDFGKKIAGSLGPGSILALYGELGAGKTTFVQGLAEGLGIEGPVQSPTFILLNLYEGKMPLYHFDLYRLKGTSDFLADGFDEYLYKDGICAIEWPDRIDSILPSGTLMIQFHHTSNGRIALWDERIPC